MKWDTQKLLLDYAKFPIQTFAVFLAKPHKRKVLWEEQLRPDVQ
jgi:hypothetical protein